MNDERRHLLRSLLLRHLEQGRTLTEIARAAGVSQPLASKAKEGRLVAETARVTKLFEFLSAGVAPMRVAPYETGDACDELGQALRLLTDGSVEGDLRLAEMLQAIAKVRMRSGRS
ncbi:hypothetical protein D8770_24710 [Methylobacterium sp. DB1607]|nr:hypothetical protein [Methylobacterium sp. DB1607]